MSSEAPMPKTSSIHLLVSIQYCFNCDKQTHDDSTFRASIASRGKTEGELLFALITAIKTEVVKMEWCQCLIQAFLGGRGIFIPQKTYRSPSGSGDLLLRGGRKGEGPTYNGAEEGEGTEGGEGNSPQSQSE